MHLRLKAALCAAALPLMIAATSPLQGATVTVEAGGEPSAAGETSHSSSAAPAGDGSPAGAATWNGLLAQHQARYAEARAWYTKAAEAGDPLATANLAFLLDRGLGGFRDAESAAAWLRRAAEAGDPASMTRYADRLRQGIGVARDEAAAASWLRKAAALGDLEGQMMLASMLERGEGAPRDSVAALAHATAAACSLSEADANHVATLGDMQGRLEAELSAAGKAQALKLAKELAPIDVDACLRHQSDAELVSQGLWMASALTLGVSHWLTSAASGMAS